MSAILTIIGAALWLSGFLLQRVSDNLPPLWVVLYICGETLFKIGLLALILRALYLALKGRRKIR